MAFVLAGAATAAADCACCIGTTVVGTVGCVACAGLRCAGDACCNLVRIVRG